MNWYKKSNKIQEESFIKKIKGKLKIHPFTVLLAKYYNIPISDIDNNLEIGFKDLDGKYAEGNGKRIDIDKKLLNNDFFSENFHFVIHEFFHWLKRRAESLFYLNDPEEVQSFVLQITWEMVDGKDAKEIRKKIFPIIKAYYKNDAKKAEEVFDKMIEKADNIYNAYKKDKVIT